MPNSTRWGSLSIKLLGIILGFSVTIAIIYLWILPKFFHGYKTYLFLIIGTSGAALIGGNCFYNSLLKSVNVKYLMSVFCGFIVAAFVLYLSLFAMTNMGGS